MSLAEVVNGALAALSQVRESQDGVVATTHCLYPSNDLVQVIVRGGRDWFNVSDGGGALREMANTGAEIREPQKLIRRVVSPHGLKVLSDGTVVSDAVSLQRLPVAIALVANASKEAVERFFDHHRIVRQRDFKRLVRTLLSTTFAGYEVNTEEAVAGESQKTHKFDTVVHLDGGRLLVIDAVVHEANAINSAVVAHLDVRKKSDPRIDQRIVYDDEENWPPPELNLLAVGAPAVPFSKSQQVFSRLLAA